MRKMFLAPANFRRAAFIITGTPCAEHGESRTLQPTVDAMQELSCRPVTSSTHSTFDAGTRLLLALFAAVSALSCHSEKATSPQVDPPTNTLLRIDSDPGTWIGGGKSYSYLLNDAKWFLRWQGPTSELLEVLVQAADPEGADWVLMFGLPRAQRLHVGSYSNSTSYKGDTTAYLYVGGDGRGCDGKGGFTIDWLKWGTAGELQELRVNFERDCVYHPGRGIRGQLVILADPPR